MVPITGQECSASMKEKLWTKDFITVSVVNFLVYTIFFLLMVTMASYAVAAFHASTSAAGLVAGIFIIGAIIGRLGTGYVIKDKGGKRVLLTGTLFCIVTSASYLAAINLPLLITFRLLHGIAYGAASTATGTIVAHIIPDSRRGEGISYYSLSVILGTALGPLIGILLIRHVGFQTIFIFTSILAVAGFAISFVVNAPAPASPGQRKGESAKNLYLSNFIEFKAIPISTVAIIVGFSYSAVLALLSLYTQLIHLEDAASFYFLVFAVTSLVSRPYSGHVFDAKGANFVIYPCLFIFAAGMVLLSQANNAFILLSTAVIIGVGYGNFVSCGQAISIKRVPSHRLGQATSTYLNSLELGIGTGPYVLGSLVPFTGYRGLYVMISLVILATVPLYHFLEGTKASSLS